MLSRWNELDVYDATDISGSVDADEAKKIIHELESELTEAEDKLSRINWWCKAYPLDVFPEPDFNVVKEALLGVGQTLDAVSASNMRHVLNGVKDIINSQ